MEKVKQINDECIDLSLLYFKINFLRNSQIQSDENKSKHLVSILKII